MPKSNSREEDERRSKNSKGRVETEHGGEVVESIAPEELEPMNDADCKHTELIPDPTETDFVAFKCANEKCGVVVLFDKTQ